MKIKLFLAVWIILISIALASAVSIKDVSSSPEEAAPGQVVDVNMKVENIFDYDVSNLHVSLDLSGENTPFAPYQSSSEKFLDELESDEDENFKFKLIILPSARTGIYKIPVNINYSYEEENETSYGGKTELISITVNSAPELKISVDDSAVLIKGKENTLSLKIINSGLSDVKFVYIGLSDASKLKILSEKEQYIGDIDSDDFDSIEYKVYLEEDAPNSMSLPVTLRFKDSTNKEFTETSTLQITAYSAKDARKLGLGSKSKVLPYLTIFILIVGYIVYRILKKRKLKKSRR